MFSIKNKNTVKAIALAAFFVPTSICLSGCMKEWDYEEVQTWYDEQPTNFEEYMSASRKMLQQNRSKRAKFYLTEAMNSIDSQYGPDDLRIATAADELGAIQEKEGLLKEAEVTYRRSFQARKNSLPKNSPDLLRTQKKLAEVLRKLFKEDEAKKVMQALDEPKSKRNSRTKRANKGKSKSSTVRRVKRHITED